MYPSIVLLALFGAAAALDYAPALKDYGSYGYDHQPSSYEIHPEHKYSYTPYGGYGHNIPAYSHYVPQYDYGNQKYGAPSYGFSKYGYGIPTYGYGHHAVHGYEGPHHNSPIPYGFPKGYGSYGKYEAPVYGHPAY